MANPALVSRVEPPPCAYVLGVPLHLVDLDGVMQRMESWIQRRDRGRWIAVTSSHGVVEALKYPDFRAILKSADLAIPDGKWTACLAGRRASLPPVQVRGTDLLLAFADLASTKGYRCFFYGDTEEVLVRLRDNLLRRYRGLVIAGTYSPPFRALTPEEDRYVTSLINQACADVLWVGLGLPKQERWIFSHRHQLNVPVMVAVGAAFKFVSGKVRPAPHCVRAWGMEWAWRFLHEPRRTWRRVVLYGPQFVAHALLELSGRRQCD